MSKIEFAWKYDNYSSYWDLYTCQTNKCFGSCPHQIFKNLKCQGYQVAAWNIHQTIWCWLLDIFTFFKPEQFARHSYLPNMQGINVNKTFCQKVTFPKHLKKLCKVLVNIAHVLQCQICTGQGVLSLIGFWYLSQKLCC